MKRLRLATAFVLLFALLAAAIYVRRVRRGTARPLAAVLATAQSPRAPDGVRIRVQVLNTTRTRGLAGRAARALRDRGFDVVEIGTVGPALDTTVVLDRSGHPAWVAAVAKVITPARTEARPDSSRYLDVTVLLGRTWRPPSKPLDP
jgi:hypothetical protein